MEDYWDLLGEFAEVAVYAIPFLIVGGILAYHFTDNWKKKPKPETKTNNFLGCFGMILLGIGVLLLIPLFELTITPLLQTAGIISILAVFGLAIFNWLRKK